MMETEVEINYDGTHRQRLNGSFIFTGEPKQNLINNLVQGIKADITRVVTIERISGPIGQQFDYRVCSGYLKIIPDSLEEKPWFVPGGLFCSRNNDDIVDKKDSVLLVPHKIVALFYANTQIASRWENRSWWRTHMGLHPYHEENSYHGSMTSDLHRCIWNSYGHTSKERIYCNPTGETYSWIMSDYNLLTPEHRAYVANAHKQANAMVSNYEGYLKIRHIAERESQTEGGYRIEVEQEYQIGGR